MKKYNIIVYLKADIVVTLSVEYDNEYKLKMDVTNIGVNGVLQKLEDKYLYYPPRKIESNEVKELKQ